MAMSCHKNEYLLWSGYMGRLYGGTVSRSLDLGLERSIKNSAVLPEERVIAISSPASAETKGWHIEKSFVEQGFLM